MSLTSIKGHNSVINFQKMTGFNPNLYLLNMNAYIKSYSFVLKLLSANHILMPNKGHNLQMCEKMMHNNPNLDLENYI